MKETHAEGLYCKSISIKDEENEYYIMKDLSRTFSSKKNFSLCPKSGENKLFNVLKAYACYDPEIGYCQGINYLVSMLLTQIKDPEEAFWSLVYIMYEHNWREVFNDKTTKLMELLEVIETKLKKKVPKVFKHITMVEDLNIAAVFSSIFITLYVYDVQYEISTRIFEMFLLDGEKFLIKLLIKMIKIK